MKLKVGVDVDGVLGDQVPPVLEKLNRKYGLDLSKEDIIDWAFPIKDTTIDVEIEDALCTERFVLEMPVVQGAKEGMAYLYKRHHILITTSRPPQTERATVKWLSSNFSFHEYCNTRGKGKGSLPVDILIDDHLQNIEEFSRNGGVGLLFSQPWNKERSEIQDLISKGMVYSCDDWKAVTKTVHLLIANKAIKSKFP